MISPVRLLLVDDSPLVLAMLKRIFDKEENIEVVGTAKDGVEALGMIEDLAPTVVCTDLFMPRMNGLELTREIMQRSPMPILVVSSGVQNQDDESVFELLKAGAVDFLPKPSGCTYEDFQTIENELIRKISVLSGVKVFRKPRPPTGNPPSESSATDVAKRIDRSGVVLLGASTGGPQTIERVLQMLPATIPYPIAVVQHIGAEFIESMVGWLDKAVKIEVCLAKDRESPRPGVAYFPPPGKQLKFLPDGRFDCSCSEPYEQFLPSVDATFMSAVKCFGKNVVACVLTGMGSDGTQGARSVREAGGFTIAQKGEGCVIDGMPRAAREAGVICREFDPEPLGAFLAKFKDFNRED